MINDINFNLNIINNNLNNIINSMNSINNILLRQQNNNYTPINFIKNIMNQNIQMANQILFNSNIINLTINNPLLFQNNNNIIEQNNQIQNIIPRGDIVDYFPGNKNRKIDIYFTNPNGSKTFIEVPIDIKIKDLYLIYAKKMEINPNLLGKEINFLFNGYKININEDKDLISFGFSGGSHIVVLDAKNIIGGISNF